MDNNFEWNLGGDFIAHRGRTNSSKTKIDRQNEFNQRRVAIDSKYDAKAEELNMLYKAEVAKGNRSDKNKLRKIQMASEKIVEDWQRELADLKEKIFNSGDDFIAHYGTKRHSGRYPWGSGEKNGKTPIHEHGEKKHKGESHHTPLSPENQKLFDLAKREDKWYLEFLEKTQNLEGITRKQLLGEYAKYLKDPKSYKAPADDYYNRSSNNSKEDADNHNSNRSSNSDIENKVSQARKTGKYDMEFLEQNGDLDDNGDLLTGKELDDSYRKWLEKNSNRHVSHSGLDSDNIVRILNTPI